MPRSVPEVQPTPPIGAAERHHYASCMTGDPGDSGNTLGEFLRARRAVVKPADVGLAPNDRRRVAGLRREEVALLAGISTEYYLRLEQGRERHPSEQVLSALARALRLQGSSE